MSYNWGPNAGGGDTWEPNPGDIITGMVSAPRPVETKFGLKDIVSITTDTGEYDLWVNGSLKSALAKCGAVPGAVVSIRYGGKVPSATGNQLTHSYEAVLAGATAAVPPSPAPAGWGAPAAAPPAPAGWGAPVAAPPAPAPAGWATPPAPAPAGWATQAVNEEPF